MERILIKEIIGKVGEKVKIAGWVDVRRDHGKLIFIDLRDRSGKIQMVVLPNHKEAHDIAQELRGEWVIEVEGIVNARPEKMINLDIETGKVEIEVEEIKILGKAKELPFEPGAEINIDTYLDYMPLTLRGEKQKAVFKVQANIVKAFRDFLTEQNFMEIQVPKIIGEDAEGGASVFDVEYFGKKAHLAQSPQFYKQIMVGVFERVFAVGNVYRAEKHSTTRHLNEYTSMDFEFGFIKDHRDVMDMLSGSLDAIMTRLREACQKEFDLLGAEIPEVPEKVPFYKLKEAQEIIKKKFGEDCVGEPDLEPQHERWLSEYAKKEHGSDFVYITHYPVEKRPMYTYEDEKDPGFTKSFDLLFRGVELVSGGQRINDYEALVESMEKKGLNPEQFAFYLQAFKYGMPPEGGAGMGLERLTAKLLNLDNVKEAALFPREMNRIDVLLSK